MTPPMDADEFLLMVRLEVERMVHLLELEEALCERLEGGTVLPVGCRLPEARRGLYGPTAVAFVEADDDEEFWQDLIGLRSCPPVAWWEDL